MLRERQRPCPRPRGRPHSTSAEVLVARAADLVRAGGSSALTIRALAAAAGVSPMAIYSYFPDREAVLDAVARAYLERSPVPVPSGDWRADLRRLAQDDWQRARREPELARLVIERAGRAIVPPALPGALFEVLVDARFSPSDAALGLSTIATFVLGSFGRLTMPGADRIDAEYAAGLELILDGIAARATAGSGRDP